MGRERGRFPHSRAVSPGASRTYYSEKFNPENGWWWRTDEGRAAARRKGDPSKGYRGKGAPVVGVVGKGGARGSEVVGGSWGARSSSSGAVAKGGKSAKGHKGSSAKGRWGSGAKGKQQEPRPPWHR